MRQVLRQTTTFAFVLLAGACGGGAAPTDNKPPTQPPVNTTPVLAVSAGDGQQALPGAAVSVSPAVVVRNTAGQPMSGVSVTFAVDSGGGSLGGPSQTTGSDGIARAGQWTLGAYEGVNVVRVAVTGASMVRIRATAVRPDAPGGGKVLGSASIPTTGGTVEAAGPDSSVHGLKLEFESGTLSKAFNVLVASVPSQDFPGKGEISPITPLIRLSASTAAMLSHPVRITIRVRVPANTFPAVTMVDQATGKRAMMPTIEFTDTSVTALLMHFDGRKVAAPIVQTSAVRAFPAFMRDPGDEIDPDLDDNGVTTILVDAMANELLNRDYDTGFRPSRDGWEFHPSTTSAGPVSWGMAFSALWYYASQPGRPALFNQFQEASNVELSNRRGLRWSAVAQRRIDLKFARGVMKTGGLKANEWDMNSLRNIRAAFARALRPEPQLVILSASGDLTGFSDTPEFGVGVYAVIAYRADAGGVAIYDPSAPGDDSRRLDFTAANGMTDYAPGSQTQLKFDTPVGGNNQALVALSRLNGDWTSVLTGDIGRTSFADALLRVRVGQPVDTVYISDTLRVWLKCALCTRGFSSTLTPALDGPVAGANVYTLNAVAGEGWKPLGSSLLGNGGVFNRSAAPAKDETIGLVTVVPNAAGNPVWHDWRKFVLRKLSATITPATASIAVGSNASFTLQVDQTKLPAAYRVEWKYGDDSQIETRNAVLTAQHAYDKSGGFTVIAEIVHPTSNQIIARATAAVSVSEPIYAAWKITSKTTALINDTRLADTRTLAQGNLWLAAQASHGAASIYQFLWNSYQADSSFLYGAQSTNAAIALVARDTLLGPPFTATTGFQRSIYWWTYGSFPTTATTPLTPGLIGSNNTLTRGTTSTTPEYSARFVQTGTTTSGRVTGLNWVNSFTPFNGSPGEPLVMFDYDVTFNGEVATGTTTKTYRLYSVDGNPHVTWAYRTTFTAQRVR